MIGIIPWGIRIIFRLQDALLRHNNRDNCFTCNAITNNYKQICEVISCYQ